MCLKMSSAKRRPSCFGLNVLDILIEIEICMCVCVNVLNGRVKATIPKFNQIRAIFSVFISSVSCFLPNTLPSIVFSWVDERIQPNALYLGKLWMSDNMPFQYLAIKQAVMVSSIYRDSNSSKFHKFQNFTHGFDTMFLKLIGLWEIWQ